MRKIKKFDTFKQINEKLDSIYIDFNGISDKDIKWISKKIDKLTIADVNELDFIMKYIQDNYSPDISNNFEISLKKQILRNIDFRNGGGVPKTNLPSWLLSGKKRLNAIKRKNK